LYIIIAVKAAIALDTAEGIAVITSGFVHQLSLVAWVTVVD